MKEKPSYYAILTADVRYDKRLNANAKLLYAEITALSEKNGVCWAGDSYFSKLYEVTPRTVQRWLNDLEKCNYIKRDVVYKDGTKEVEKRYITIIKEVVTKMSAPYGQKCQGGTDKNVVVNTTRVNTTSTNEVHIVKDEDLQPKERIPYKEIIEYLNEVTKQNFNRTTPSYRKSIKVLWDKGNRLKDFKHVIDVKSYQWLDKEWQWRGQTTVGNNLLNPHKLFGKDFDKYLNEEMPKAKQPKQTTTELKKEAFQTTGIDISSEVDF